MFDFWGVGRGGSESEPQFCTSEMWDAWKSSNGDVDEAARCMVQWGDSDSQKIGA